MIREEREFNVKIYKINKYYIELFIKLFEKKHNKIFNEIKNKLKRKLKQNYPNLNIDNEIINIIKNKKEELKNFYDKFVELFIRAIYQKSTLLTEDFLYLFQLEPKTNIFDIKSLNLLIKQTRGELEKTLTLFDTVLDAFYKIKAVNNEKEINDILIKNLLYGRNIKKAEKDLVNYLISFTNENNKIIINNRQYNLKYYANMVARSRLREASTLGILEEAKKFNINLFRFSIHNTRCPICKPYEGKIFSLEKNKNYELLKKRPPLHPNCLHSLIPVYLI